MNLYKSNTYIQDLDKAISLSINIDLLKDKVILITGPTGTIGSFLVDMFIRCNELGYNITIVLAGRSKKNLIDRFGLFNDHIIYVKYDMLESIDFNMQVDYVIHAAGNAHPTAFNSDPVGTIVGNINGTYQLLEYSKRYMVKRFCYISTGEVYGQGNIELKSYTEEYSGYLDILSPRSCYPSSKRTAENLCVSYYKEYGLETIIVRPSHTYGPGLTDNDSRAQAQFIRSALAKSNIVMKSRGTQLRSYCYIADCASAIITCLINGEPGQAYNSANNDSTITIAGFAEIVAKYAGTKVVYDAPSEDDIINRSPILKQVLDSKKLEALGWKGYYNIEKGIGNTISILKELK